MKKTIEDTLICQILDMNNQGYMAEELDNFIDSHFIYNDETDEVRLLKNGSIVKNQHLRELVLLSLTAMYTDQQINLLIAQL